MCVKIRFWNAKKERNENKFYSEKDQFFEVENKNNCTHTKK